MVGQGVGVHVRGVRDELLVTAVEGALADPLHRDAAARDRGAQAVGDLGERVDVEGLRREHPVRRRVVEDRAVGGHGQGVQAQRVAHPRHPARRAARGQHQRHPVRDHPCDDRARAVRDLPALAEQRPVDVAGDQAGTLHAPETMACGHVRIRVAMTTHITHVRVSASMTTIDALLHDAGRTFADEAGIELTNEPAPLYRLLVLSTLLSRRVQSKLGTRACRELLDAGMGTPERMRDADWETRVRTLGRANYTGTEQTATALGDGAVLRARRVGRRPAPHAGGRRRRRREARGVPHRRAPSRPRGRRHLHARGPGRVARVPAPPRPQGPGGREEAGATAGSAAKLAEQVSGDDVARLAAALVRADRDSDVREDVRSGLVSRPHPGARRRHTPRGRGSARAPSRTSCAPSW